jgi:hypothetical protein
MGIILGLFACAALGGLFLAVLRVREKTIPLPFALGHGALALSGLGVLIARLLKSDESMLAPVSLAMFILAALMGFALLVFHLLRYKLPLPLLVLHGLAATAGISVLVFVMAGLG